MHSAPHYTALALVVVLVALIGAELSHCVHLPVQPVEDGSQGYRIWSGESLTSFRHGGLPVCVPSGWEAIGAVKTGPGMARFRVNETGLFIRSDAFRASTISVPESSYAVTLRYPASTSPFFLSQYIQMTENAFARVGSLYNDSRDLPARTHTVLVTAGLAGDTRTEGSRVYPDPGPLTSMIVRTPQPRSDQLLIHAVMHLYNRHQETGLTYQKHQSPFSPEDFQELEAAWAETEFAFTPESRSSRLTYLYTVHTAVRTKDFSLITGPPFNDEETFAQVAGTAVVPPDSNYLEYQYGHYILAPLVATAINGLLIEHRTGATVETILKKVHTEENLVFLDEVSALLSEEDMARVRSWIAGTETIPRYLILN